MVLGRAIQEGYNILDFDFCANLSAEDFDKILRASTEIPLFNERFVILNEIGLTVLKKYNGKLANLIN